jgi:hypothetical protein
VLLLLDEKIKPGKKGQNLGWWRKLPLVSRRLGLPDWRLREVRRARGCPRTHAFAQFETASGTDGSCLVDTCWLPREVD